MKFIVTFKEDEDGGYTVECPTLPGCITHGSTREEALANIREAVELAIEVRKEKGLPLDFETAEIEVAV